MAKKKSKKKQKVIKKQRQVFAIHKNKLFFGMFIVMILVFGLSFWQQTYGQDLAGMATMPAEKETGYKISQYEHKTTSNGEPCINIINDVPYIHPECIK
ncbi:hypothetical protein COV16_03805 [Candidatus Woesearchaeota archaeon CG10_big_fil_rev_8_21_14_0_10_34_8]|nr:MAG: hypothetical protein COV16_03805 [Candidatus Woesearchaeota archaeon CG10_big_fil_rev_8_21_14_0_10_34_8]